MGLTDALFTGTSGLRSLGHGMSVVGDNVANLNTTAFKGSRISFSDIMAQSINTAAGSGQLGRGATLQALYPIFTQGSFESTANPTDLAIAGNGFFIVADPRASGNVFYTRDGQFMIDKEGYLVNAAGLRVQGWRIDEDTGDITGAITDIRIDRSSPPVKTSLVDVIANLNAEIERTITIDTAGGTSSTDDDVNFADNSITDNNGVTLYGKWNASSDPPLATTDYDYRTSLYVYDSLGTPHEITIYYKAANLITSDGTTTETKPVYEFLVTCNHDEDLRQGFPVPEKKGILMYGMLEFDTQGNVKNFLNVYRYGWDATNDQYQLVRIVDDSGSPQSPPPNDAFADNTNFTTTIDTLGANSYPVFIADFLGIEVADSGGVEDPAATQNLQPIELNFGYYHDGTSWRSETVRTTQYSAPFATLFYDQNGFGPGTLESIAADNEGRITGYYSNGRVIPLWMVALANFNAPERLQKVGGNLFKETTHSGPPVTGKPGTNGLGTIAPNSIEQSNVDLGEQFVKMIIFQRGFQADARIITVSDSMLEELINLKR
ncbi:MAG: flagellar hook-basal body complex protein [Thermodesulfobacterium sp.]|nr:flagellar hook-basal body complex protein [Thermodesulfobacterium sp.]